MINCVYFWQAFRKKFNDQAQDLIVIPGSNRAESNVVNRKLSATTRSTSFQKKLLEGGTGCQDGQLMVKAIVRGKSLCTLLQICERKWAKEHSLPKCILWLCYHCKDHFIISPSSRLLPLAMPMLAFLGVEFSVDKSASNCHVSCMMQGNNMLFYSSKHHRLWPTANVHIVG